MLTYLAMLALNPFYDQYIFFVVERFMPVRFYPKLLGSSSSALKKEQGIFQKEAWL